VVVGIDGAGEESAAVVFGSVSALTHRCRTRETVQLLGCASHAVSHVRVLAVASPEHKYFINPRAVSHVRVLAVTSPEHKYFINPARLAMSGCSQSPVLNTNTL
jgi:hypothetical protein